MEYLDLHQHFSNGLSFEASEGSVIIRRVSVCSDTKEGYLKNKEINTMLLNCQTKFSNMKKINIVTFLEPKLGSQIIQDSS